MIAMQLPLDTRVFFGFVLAASIAVLGGALLSQYWGGLVPCELCIAQRWPWVAAIAISLLALIAAGRAALPWIALLLTAAYIVGTVLAFYHVGVEQHWFAGPTACTTSATGAMTLEQMKAQIMGTAPVLCDKVQWSLGGVSLAGWNLIASFVMAAICLAAFVRARREPFTRRRIA